MTTLFCEHIHEHLREHLRFSANNSAIIFQAQLDWMLVWWYTGAPHVESHHASLKNCSANSLSILNLFSSFHQQQHFVPHMLHPIASRLRGTDTESISMQPHPSWAHIGRAGRHTTSSSGQQRYQHEALSGNASTKGGQGRGLETRANLLGKK